MAAMAAMSVTVWGSDPGRGPRMAGSAPSLAPPSSSSSHVVTSLESAGVRLQVTEVARGLDTVWSLAWDPGGALWYTERSGRLTKLGEQPQQISGVEEVGEGGLMGLEIDARGRRFLMYAGSQDDRVVRLEPDGSQRVLVAGIAKADFHNGGRLRLGADGYLYASAGDASNRGLARDQNSLNGKILRIHPESGESTVWSSGHRNVQGLCFAADGRLLATEHGPDGNDEVNLLTHGFDGGWPATSGNGLKNYPTSIAPAGCAVYNAALVPSWRGSMLFATLAGQSLRRLMFRPDGSVGDEEVLLPGQLGRLRDVGVGPDGAVYVATSNRDQRGTPRDVDDRILRIAPG
jgi:glucose/arabinose dehydrogenase